MGKNPLLVDLVRRMTGTPPTAANLPSAPDDAWLKARLALRAELTIEIRKQGDRFVAIIEDPTRSKFFQVGHAEYHFISMLDGRRSVSEVIELVQSERAIQDFSADTARAICFWLAHMNLLAHQGAGASQRLTQAAHAKQKQKWLALLNPICFRVNLLNPQATLQRITPWTKWLLSSWMLVVWTLAAVLAVAMIVDQSERFADAAVGILAPGRWIWLLVIWVALKIVHEAAHGVACQKYGGEVRQAGLLILLLAPLAFVDVTSSWRFSSRRKRIVVSAAGMYVELLIAFVAAIAWASASPGILSDICYNIVVMAGISTILFNANPLIRFDGYYILADVLGIANLYTKGQSWFADRFRHLVFGFPTDPNICLASELKWVASYGLLAFAWRVFLCASLLLVASTLLNGAGLIMALIGGIFWVLLPLYMFVKKTRQLAQTHAVDKRRLTLCAAGLAAIVACFLLVQAPPITRAPAIVQFKQEQILRAAADGFVSEILVQNGQSVQQGQLLVQMVNPDLQLEHVALTQAAERARIRARIHRQRGELSQQQAELLKFESIQTQLAEKQRQLENLQIHSPIEGVVYRRGLENLIDSFVKQGDPVLTVAQHDVKEILVSIGQDQIKSVRQNDTLPVRVMFQGTPVLQANIATIRPRASLQPIDASLCAIAGGPLAVRPVEDSSTGHSEASDLIDDYRLLVPQFTAKLELSSDLADQLWAGQRGTAFLYGRDISLGSYCYLQCRDWVRSKLQAATQLAF